VLARTARRAARPRGARACARPAARPTRELPAGRRPPVSGCAAAAILMRPSLQGPCMAARSSSVRRRAAPRLPARESSRGAAPPRPAASRPGAAQGDRAFP